MGGGGIETGEGWDAAPAPNPHFGVQTCLAVEGASIPENALGPGAVVRSVVAARGGHGAVDHEQLLHR